jgi:hypothetical protein
MKISKLVGMAAIALTGLFATAAGAADPDQFRADLAGFREIPAISTLAKGEFRAAIINDNTIAYELTYSGLEGNVTQGHIHFGQRFANGGISLWLCQVPGTTTDPAGLAPTCPQEAQGATTVTGHLTLSNLVGPEGQGISGTAGRNAGEFAEILKAIRAGLTYANVHSTKFPSGEIRGQIKLIKDKEDSENGSEDPGITPGARLLNNRTACKDNVTSVTAVLRLRTTADDVQMTSLGC